MDRPASTTPGSVMPAYTHLKTNPFDTSLIGSKMRALRSVGVPYTDGEIESAPASIAAQAKAITAEVEAQQGPTGLADKEITALTAYLQRLGTDIKWKRSQPQLPSIPAPAFATPISPVASARQAQPAADEVK
jgi:cbb3-type cytochrome oxidase cytochrome c subunit